MNQDNPRNLMYLSNLKCPIYNEKGVCKKHKCSFFTGVDCAVILNARLSEENRQKLDRIETNLKELFRCMNINYRSEIKN